MFGHKKRGNKTNIKVLITAGFQILYHMFIFDSDAENVDNHQVECDWNEGLLVISGNFGLKGVIEYPSIITVSKSELITNTFFLYINISSDWKYNDSDDIISGLLLIKTNASP